MNAAIARIIIRYLTAALATWGLMNDDIARMIGTDPDIEFIVVTLISTIVAAANEWWYVSDRKKGKTT